MKNILVTASVLVGLGFMVSGGAFGEVSVSKIDKNGNDITISTGQLRREESREHRLDQAAMIRFDKTYDHYGKCSVDYHYSHKTQGCVSNKPSKSASNPVNADAWLYTLSQKKRKLEAH